MVNPINFLRLTLLLVAAPLVLLACTECEPILWIAKTDTTLYRSTAGDELAENGTIHPGEVCAPGRQVTEKMFNYFELVCQDGKYGWSSDQDHFSVVRGPH